MTYEYKRRGMGYWDPRGTCSQVSGGETRCFRPSEVAAATRNRCRSTSQSCTVSGSSGTTYCCPRFGSVRPPTTSGGDITGLLDTLATTGGGSGSGGGALTQAANAVKGILGFGVSTQTTAEASPTAQGFSDYAKNAAVTEAAAVEEEVIGPVEEEPGGSSGNWLNRYQTHITIASTAIGLVTFVIWLVVKKK